MRRRSRTGDEPAKARRRKTETLKPRIAPKPAPDRRLSAASLRKQLDHRTRERDEALEQQTAISDILRVISNSPSDLQPVLDSVAEHAARICEAKVVDIGIAENNM